MNTTTLSVTSASATSVNFTLSDSNITGATYGSAAWYKDSKIMFSGTVRGNKNNTDIIFSSAPGTVTATMGTTAHTLQISVDYKNASTYFETGNNLTYEDVSVMMYQIHIANGTTQVPTGDYPIGIYMKAYSSDKSTFIDVYGGTSQTPSARMGLLNNLNLSVNDQPTTGFGLYTNNGYFNGTLVSTNGIIGGWTLGQN